MPRTLFTIRDLTTPVRSLSSVTPLCIRRSGVGFFASQKTQTLERQLVIYLQQQQRFTKHTQGKRDTNMSFLLPGLRRGFLLSTPLVLSAPLLIHQYRNARMPVYRCDGPDPLTKITNDLGRNYASGAKTPIITESGAANPRAIRQISMGSILGVFCGLGISVFSKPLAILLGLGILAVQVSLFLDRYIIAMKLCISVLQIMCYVYMLDATLPAGHASDAYMQMLTTSSLLSLEASILSLIHTCNADSSRPMYDR